MSVQQVLTTTLIPIPNYALLVAQEDYSLIISPDPAYLLLTAQMEQLANLFQVDVSLFALFPYLLSSISRKISAKLLVHLDYTLITPQ